MKSRFFHPSVLGLALLLAAFVLVLPQAADAQIFTGAPQPGDCTTDPAFNVTPPAHGDGLVSNLAESIQTFVDQMSQALFLAVQSGIIGDLRALLTLYIVIYGILFTFGMTQMTLYDFTMRMIKFGIILALFDPGAYNFFMNTVGRFFQDGTDAIINYTTSIAFGVPFIQDGAAFYVLDDVIAKVASGKMFVTWLAMAFTGPYGPMFAILTAMALFSLAKAMVMAVWVYLMALVLRALLFGLAPLFIAFLLFDRTRHLFEGWLNQLVNTMLQPVFLFVFFTFFCILMSIAIDDLLRTPVCWTQATETMRGTAFHMHYWRFEVHVDGNWQPYGGNWSWLGPDLQNTPIFPIDIMAILIMLILGELANRFNHVVVMIASDFASASTNLGNFRGGIPGWGGGAQGLGSLNRGIGKVGQRNVPGGRSLPGGRSGPGGAGNVAAAAEGAAAATGSRGSPS